MLRAAGNLQSKFTDEREDVLMLRAITDVNLPKFLDQDVPLFKGILSDLFPGLNSPRLTTTTSSTRSKQLREGGSATPRVLLREDHPAVRDDHRPPRSDDRRREFRHEVELHPVSWRTPLGELNEKDSTTENKVKYYCINPKSVTMSQLYGAEDPCPRSGRMGSSR